MAGSSILQKEGDDQNGGLQKGGDDNIIGNNGSGAEGGDDMEKGKSGEDEDGEGEGAEDEDDLEKSLSKLLGRDDNLAKSIDASPVLEAMVDGLDEILGGFQDAMSKSIGAVENVTDLLARGMVKLMADNRQQADLIKSLAGDMATLAGRPATQARKSVKPGQVLEKSVNAPSVPVDNLGGGIMSHAETQQRLVKSVGEGKVPYSWVGYFDKNHTLPDDVMAAINR
jgi:hypothetical protein